MELSGPICWLSEAELQKVTPQVKPEIRIDLVILVVDRIYWNRGIMTKVKTCIVPLF